MKRAKYLGGMFLGALVFFLSSCESKDDLYPNPYAGGRSPLGIQFESTPPLPASGGPGDEVTYKITGLLQYKSDLQFFVNNQLADVLTLTDSTVTVKIPENASTGGASVTVNDQIFFGPSFQVTGKVYMDQTFKASVGANYSINDIHEMENGNILMVGAFTDFDKKASTYPVNRIVMTTSDGEYLPTLLSGSGSNGSLSSIIQLPNNKLMVGGGFSSYGNRPGILNMTRLNENGSLDSTQVRVVNLTPEEPLNDYDTVATFNGGVGGGSISKLFYHDDKITAIGNFNSYGSYFYERSTRETKLLDATKMKQLIRVNLDGSLDSGYNFNPATGESYEAANGRIADGFMQDDGKIVMVGSFSMFNGESVGYIARINEDGSLDPSFNTGTGADDMINNVRYNANTHKIMLSGTFRNFNGSSANGIAMLNEDGSIDPSFQFGELLGGRVNFASQLSNGLVLVAGSFTSYQGIYRDGFMILNPDGSLAENYNNTGSFQGIINDVFETQSALGKPAVLIVGRISKFDNKQVGNICRIVVEN